MRQPFSHSFKDKDMRARKIRHMNIIPDRGPVRGGIIITKNINLLTSFQRGLEKNRNQVSLRGMILPHVTLNIRPRGVEISQKRHFQTVRSVIAVQQPFQTMLRNTIGVFRGRRMGLLNRNYRGGTIHGSRGRKHKAAHTVFHQGRNQTRAFFEIIFKIFFRRSNRLPDKGICREVNCPVHLVGPDNISDKVSVSNIPFNQGNRLGDSGGMPLFK